MIELKDYQQRAIRELQEKIVTMLNREQNRQKLIFRAPTGSGKTVMTSALLDRLTAELPTMGDCLYTQVAWIWIAPNKLHLQSYLSMRSYFSETRSLRPVLFDECEVQEGLQQGDVLFLNWESITKDNALLIRDNEQNRNLYELVRHTRITKGIPIVCIIDEEHMYAGRNAKKSEIVLQNIAPKIELRISATPQTQGDALVNIPREDVIAEEMIKRGVVLNPNINKPLQDKTLTVNQQLLQRALDKREALRKAYAEYGINPLLLIQLPNDSMTESTDDKSIAEEMTAYLRAMCGISEENGKLAIWLSDKKTPNIDTITRPNDLTEVLLFKQAIALGWDCPRAAVLLIFRDVKSVSFTTQTVGRILRMPNQHFYPNELLNYGYVYTNIAANVIQIVADDMNYLTTVYANRRKDLNNISLRSTAIIRSGQEDNNLYAWFKQVFIDVLKAEWDLENPTLFDHSYYCEPEENTASSTDKTNNQLRIDDNRRRARQHGVTLDVKNISIEVPKDTRFDGGAGRVEIVEKARLVRTEDELRQLFKQFCRQHIHPYSKTDSVGVLAGAIEKALEDYLQVKSTAVPRIVLYKTNRPRFEALIRKALDRYAVQYRQRKKEINEKQIESIWSVPETRLYNAEQVRTTYGEIFHHALDPYMEQRTVSQPEYLFARWLDQQTEAVDWWYKNGDAGKQHFAIPYQDSQQRWRCFYVDFIVRLKNGTIYLLDTKTLGSDENGAAKNNALYEYVKQYREKGLQIYGGVLIQEGENRYFPDALIDNITDIRGWKCLQF